MATLEIFIGIAHTFPSIFIAFVSHFFPMMECRISYSGNPEGIQPNKACLASGAPSAFSSQPRSKGLKICPKKRKERNLRLSDC